jgi:hypothetical protein
MTLDEEDKDGEARARGREAYHAGLLPTDNTYKEGSPQNIAWSRGYDVAKAEGPPVPTNAAKGLRQDAVFDRAAKTLEEAVLNYIDARREYCATECPARRRRGVLQRLERARVPRSSRSERAVPQRESHQHL